VKNIIIAIFIHSFSFFLVLNRVLVVVVVNMIVNFYRRIHSMYSNEKKMIRAKTG